MLLEKLFNKIWNTKLNYQKFNFIIKTMKIYTYIEWKIIKIMYVWGKNGKAKIKKEKISRNVK